MQPSSVLNRHAPLRPLWDQRARQMRDRRLERHCRVDERRTDYLVAAAACRQATVAYI
jgi:hypothetical protein